MPAQSGMEEGARVMARMIRSSARSGLVLRHVSVWHVSGPRARDGAVRNVGQHASVPLLPLPGQAIERRAVEVAKVRPLHRVLGHVEQEAVLANRQELVVALAYGPLGVGFEPPVESARQGLATFDQ